MASPKVIVMGNNYTPSTKANQTGQNAQAGVISTSQKPAHLSLMSVMDRITALGNAMRRRRPAAAPTLRFDGAAPRPHEPDSRRSFHDEGSSAIEHAQQLEDLQDAAAMRLDAAVYALSRLRLELAAVAPELVDSLPDALALERDRPALASLPSQETTPMARSKPNVSGQNRHDIAA